MICFIQLFDVSNNIIIVSLLIRILKFHNRFCVVSIVLCLDFIFEGHGYLEL